MDQVVLSPAVVALAGCSITTKVLEYRSTPGGKVFIGSGGAMRKLGGVDIWLDDGEPPRPFRLVAQASTTYRTGTAGDVGQRQSALEQLAAEATKRGADAVIVLDEESRFVGYAGSPGTSLRVHQLRAALVKYEGRQ